MINLTWYANSRDIDGPSRPVAGLTIIVGTRCRASGKPHPISPEPRAANSVAYAGVISGCASIRNACVSSPKPAAATLASSTISPECYARSRTCYSDYQKRYEGSRERYASSRNRRATSKEHYVSNRKPHANLITTCFTMSCHILGIFIAFTSIGRECRDARASHSDA